MKLLAMVALLVTICSLEGEFMIQRKEAKGKKVWGGGEAWLPNFLMFV